MATLTIKNLKKLPSHQTALWETGLQAVQDATALAADTLEDHLPPCNTKEYEGTIEIPVYGNRNQYILLKSGETATINTSSDAELAFYLAMREEGILEVTGAEIVTPAAEDEAVAEEEE